LSSTHLGPEQKTTGQIIKLSNYLPCNKNSMVIMIVVMDSGIEMNTKMEKNNNNF